MATQFKQLFTRHPASVNESYFEHLCFAASFAGQLLLAGLAALVHSLLPFFFETTASRIVDRLHARIHRRR